MRLWVPLALTSLVASGCIELDFLFFENETADMEADYHNLPLTIMDDAPEWIADALVEREVYVDSATGRPLSAEARERESQYIHGAFLRAPVACPETDCPLAGRGVTFLYQHGNSGHLYRYWYRAVALWAMGANVFVYTYRGYGLSGGEASRRHVLDDAEAAATYVFGRDDVDSERVIAYGYSMGGIPTSYLIGRSSHAGKFFGGVLEAALDSPDSTLNLSASTEFPVGFFMDETVFDGPAFLKDALMTPILHVHGAVDDRVVIEQAEQYAAVLKGWDDYTDYIGKSDRADETWIATAGHRNIPIVSFKAEHHIPDYYDSVLNPTRCCIHPLEYTDPAHAGFFDAVGKTDGEAMSRDALRYRALVSSWILQRL